MNIDPTTPLGDFHRLSIEPALLYDVPIRLPPFATNPYPGPEYYELILWHIPQKLDPTYHPEHAQKFHQLGRWFRRVEGDEDNFATLTRDLVHAHRGWARSDTVHGKRAQMRGNTGLDTATQMGAGQAAPSSTSILVEMRPPIAIDRPIDSTHVFILWWRVLEAASRFKDPSQKAFSGGLGKLNAKAWKDGFLDLRREWLDGGMKVKSYPLIMRYLRSSEMGS